MAHEYAPVTVQGRPLRCLVCSHDAFAEQHIQLSTQVFSFMDPDSHAHCAVCARCGYVHMFIPAATIPVDDPAAGTVPGGPAPTPA
jgi:predicted nucleic-acid-binding Zn-ribbon protein